MNYSQYMLLQIPTIGSDSSNSAAQFINSSFYTMDKHDHSPGKGLILQTSSLNINQDFSINNNNIINVNSIVLFPKSLDPSTIGTLYSKGVDLYFRDLNNNIVQITKSGNINITSGSIVNLNSPASLYYDSIGQAYSFFSSLSIPANLDIGSLIIGNNVANSPSAIIAPPSATITSAYSLTFPIEPPTELDLMVLEPSGQMAAALIAPSLFLNNSTYTLSLTPKGVQQAQIAPMTAVGSSGVPAYRGVGFSNPINLYTTNGGEFGLGNTFVTASGTRPVIIGLSCIPFPGGPAVAIIRSENTPGSLSFINVYRNGTLIFQSGFQPAENQQTGLTFVDFPPAGVMNYQINAYTSGGGAVQFSNMIAYSYEVF